MANSSSGRTNKLVFLISLTLVCGTVACYWAVRRFDFISLDDPLYVYHNDMVQRGLSGPGVVWAFKSVQGGNWNPLVWLSHMADSQFFGKEAGGRHLTNVLLHAANVLVLFLTLRRMTGAAWRSAFVAGLFAWHPLHVESVAWISERKDVLSTLFWLLTMWAYAKYAKSDKTQAARHRVFYAVALVFFILGLMSKPMLVTLPVILLLLDYWPLQRAESLRKLLLEKAPFVVLSFAACLLAFWAQKKTDAVGAQDTASRLENAMISYGTYLVEFFWPVKLAVFYPYPHSISLWRAGIATMVLGVITGLVWATRRRAHYLTGWLWFLVTLSPVVGIIQVGMQARADRYTYIPYIGLAIMLSWGLGDLVRRWPGSRPGVAAASAAMLVCCLLLTANQIQYWSNSGTLFQHALDVTSENYIAHSNLGDVYAAEGKLDEAIKEYKEAIRIAPQLPNPYNDLGKAYAMQNKMDDAFAMFSSAIQLAPNLPEAQWNYGHALVLRGRVAEGLAEMEKSVRQRPDNIEKQREFAEELFSTGKGADALPYCEAVAQAKPNDPHAQFFLGAAYLAQKREKEAAKSFATSVRLAPDNPQCLNALAWIYATSDQRDLRNGPEAVRLAGQACAITKRQNVVELETLAAAYAQAGRFEDAIKTAREMLALANSSHNTVMADTARKHLKLYESAKTCCGAE